MLQPARGVNAAYDQFCDRLLTRLVTTAPREQLEMQARR